MRRSKRAMGLAAIALALLAAPALAATGDLDPSFGGDGTVEFNWGGNLTERGQDLALAPDGRILVLGPTGMSGIGSGDYDFGFARLRANGDLDSTFGSGGRSKVARAGVEHVSRLALQADGKVVAVGTNGTLAEIMRVGSTGALDPDFNTIGVSTFGYGSSAALNDVALQRDGKILIAADGGPLDTAIVSRLLSDGEFDPTFGSGGTSTVELGGLESANAVAVQRDGKVVIAGASVTTAARSVIVGRFNADGTADTSFGTGGHMTLGAAFGTDARDVAIQPDGGIVLATTGGTAPTIARLKPDGSPDTGFDDDGIAVVNFSLNGSARALALQADGKIVVAAAPAGQSSLGFVARLQPSGLPDATFHGSGKVELPGVAGPSALVIQPDGKILLTSGNTLPSTEAVVARLQGDSPGVSGGGGPTGGGPSGAKPPRCAGKKATIVGTKRADKLKGTSGADVIVTLGGNDKVDGGRGNDLICAGDGNDGVKGGAGNDRLYGQNGKDTEAGGPGNDRVDGGSGNDKLAGDAGNDRLTGSAGNDSLTGGPGKDGISGGAGRDRLSGGSGRDGCNGGGGKDRAACERSRAV